jgi:site-specific DNA-adenine methylase
MLGVYRHIPELLKDISYYANDKNEHVITLWQALQRGWKPPTEAYSKKQYIDDKEGNNKSLDSIFYGFACSYRGDFRAGYFDRNNIESQASHCIEIAKKISMVTFSCGSFEQYCPKGFIIYCDPPYKGTKNNYYEGNSRNSIFDYDLFIEWCKEMSQFNLVFISEYTKPCKESKLLWTKGKERLYVINL